jgi:dihydroxyacetone kinase
MQDEVQCGFGFRVMARHDTREVRERQVEVVSGGACGHSTSGAFIGAGMLSGEVWREAGKAPVSQVCRKFQSRWPKTTRFVAVVSL